MSAGRRTFLAVVIFAGISTLAPDPIGSAPPRLPAGFSLEASPTDPSHTKIVLAAAARSPLPDVICTPALPKSATAVFSPTAFSGPPESTFPLPALPLN